MSCLIWDKWSHIRRIRIEREARAMKMSSNVPDELLQPLGDATHEVGPFVLNLCAVRSPLAIPPLRAQSLVKYCFFVSRGFEGDRERFWLHMGYFDSRDEAHKW